MGEAQYLPARSFDERVATTRAILASKSKSLTYLYFPELDSIAHSSGAGSIEWLNKIEELDAAIKNLVSDLSSESAVLLTADHGIVDVFREQQVYLDELQLSGLIAVTGDPRNSFLYFDQGADVATQRGRLQEQLGEKAIVCSSSDLIEQGWFGQNPANEDYLPDLFVISQPGTAIYHRDFAKPQSLRMIGQHGGISQAELSVPLLRFGAYAD
jgi:hypothetical protein